jgi:acetyl-CoA/propionyl-CoA carboxylase, biotin carboxylase, biotin carboxyl carrier protein
MLPSKILVANRGEIAVRVMRTCKELGIGTVAVYSDVDREAYHVRYADEAYAIGGDKPADSYLNTPKILEVIERSGAQAVHPGYGFFSENADFAQAIIDLPGVTWIGPPPSAITIMGDKISSRLAADEAGVLGVPGINDSITDPAVITAFGATHGYPVAIKAAYGGGGRGMKVVHSADEVESAMAAAQREAQNYFGRPEIYVERYLARPRHIEIQVFCDTHGNAVWLGERDCSTQRRHQKLIEESPAAGITEETRRAMGEAAVQAALGCGYVNAGTVEMLYQDGEFYFLEMNTRLQVEHCVTEMCVGIDLVAEQIRVAMGAPLSFTQDSIVRRGHAIQCRINAEDPARKFAPTPGTLTRYRAPSGYGVRVDGGYETGDTISQYYDNLIAKLVVWGADREEARLRMIRALAEYQIEGVHTTIPAHNLVLTNAEFIASTHSTRWVEDEIGYEAFAAQSADAVAPTADAAGDPVALVERTVPVEVDGKRFAVRVWLPDLPVAVVGAGGTSGAGAAGGTAAGGAKRPRARAATGAAGGGSGTVTAPMQGTIVKVNVEVGATVAVDDTLLVLEAMKMENSIKAEISGVVTEIRVKPGDTVGGGDVLMVLAPPA